MSRSRQAATLSVRTAEESDAADLSALAERTFRATFAEANDVADLEAHCAQNFGVAIQRREIQDSGMRTLLACIGDGITGYSQVRLHAPKDCVETQRPAELLRIYVDAGWHGRGVAQALMSASVDVARDAGCDSIWLGVWEHNPRAIAFYRKLGFEPVGEHVFKLGNDPQRDVVMARPLRDRRRS